MATHTLLTLLAQQAAPTPAAGSIVGTVWDMTLRGGWIMIPLAICSLVAMTIVVERLILTRRSRVTPRATLEAIRSSAGDPERLRASCAGDSSPLASVLLAGAKAAGGSRAQQEQAISDAGEREIRKLRHRMRLLGSLPQVATMLGLLGTVLGMIRTFTVVAASGESLGKTERLAQGIHEAWTATAGGLIIAIPTLLAFQVLLGRIDAAAEALDLAAKDWLDTTESPSALEPSRVAAPRVPATRPAALRPLPIADGELAGSAGA